MLSRSTSRAFTLIELLIVVAIIAILAAIAVPNFLEAQTRSKVSRARADMRTLATGLESYFVDNNGYPWQNVSSRALNPPSLGIAPGYGPTLERLTTPVSYLSGGVFTDPFVAAFTYQGADLETVQPVASYQAIDRPSFESYWYQARQRNASNWGDPADERPTWWLLSSAGPDRHQHNAGTFFNSGGVSSSMSDAAMVRTLKLIYDPTNGTISRGSLWRLGGQPGGTGQVFARALQQTGN